MPINTAHINRRTPLPESQALNGIAMVRGSAAFAHHLSGRLDPLVLLPLPDAGVLLAHPHS